ncbi:MAG: hypothetical protein WBA61_09800 [Aequorivita sp.]
MELAIYLKEYDIADSVQNFMNFYYAKNMTHLASDLLDRGLSPKQITTAISAAIKSANASGAEVHKHFMLVYSGLNQSIIQDCKLSDLGYGLVLMNADPNLAAVSKFQTDVLKQYFRINK